VVIEKSEKFQEKVNHQLFFSSEIAGLSTLRLARTLAHRALRTMQPFICETSGNSEGDMAESCGRLGRQSVHPAGE
jgi:hypothetical protein